MKNKVRVNPGVGYTFYGGPEGVAFDIQQGGTAGFLHPFKVKLKKVGGVLKAFVRAGTVNNVVPTASSKALDDPTNEGVTVSEDDGTMNVLLKVTGESGKFFPEAAVIEVASSVPADTNSNGYLNLASISFNNGTPSVNQFVFASQIAVRAKPGTATAIWLFSSR